ncbi:hypothetical protein [Corynebacterium ulcerans]|uniref:hypothetical protein n=1 Tax=Corynebacterium ulcerans TaxID=65058 RepID=UPI001305242A|nr:hypothetical protein [Corynebacterium ulcerans]
MATVFSLLLAFLASPIGNAQNELSKCTPIDAGFSKNQWQKGRLNACVYPLQDDLIVEVSVEDLKYYWGTEWYQQSHKTPPSTMHGKLVVTANDKPYVNYQWESELTSSHGVMKISVPLTLDGEFSVTVSGVVTGGYYGSEGPDNDVVFAELSVRIPAKGRHSPV